LTVIAVDPGNPAYVYAGRSVLVITHGALVGGGVIWSSDRGEHWSEPTTLLLEDVLSVAVSPGDGSVLAGTLSGIRRSVDHALTWSDTGLAGLGVRDIRFAPDDPRIAYAASSSGVYRSEDGGTSWVAAGLSGASVNALAVDAATAYAGTDGPGIFITHDRGRTWFAMAIGGIRGSTVTALAIDESRDSLVASTDRGVFRRPSRDRRTVERH
jgi:photosystem II stability/assembly factor-like uncharacterized protein